MKRSTASPIDHPLARRAALSAVALLAGSCATLSPVATTQRSGVIRLDVATSKPAYRIGEALEFTVRPSEDCRFQVSVVGADGHEKWIYPNSHSDGDIFDGRMFRAGTVARFPEASGAYTFRVKGPVGRDTLWIEAATGSFLEGDIWYDDASESARALGRRGSASVTYDVLP